MILTPHIGGSTLEAQEAIGHFVTQRLLEYWEPGFDDAFGQSAADNAEILRLRRTDHPPARQSCRASWQTSIKCCAEAGINVTAQSLGTQGELGYVVTDVSSAA
jgi:D-3-phosphoglycerate dehydrogenase